MIARRVVCRDCGDTGIEDLAEDLMPNTCPTCFERRIADVFRSRPLTVSALRRALVEAGCVDRLVDDFLASQPGVKELPQ